MDDLNTIFDKSRTAGEIITSLKEKSVLVPDWSKLREDYFPELHRIVHDHSMRRDKVRSDGNIDKASRIHIGLERLLAKRTTEFMYAIPVKRIYHNIAGNETRQQIAQAIERIYKTARIDAENIRRGNAYFSACEAFTLWYAEEKPNTLYGFNSQYKLKCRTFSPMDGVRLYPLINERGDMEAMSFEYDRKVMDETVTYFEAYTANEWRKWEYRAGTWRDVSAAEPVTLGKIPGVYIWRPVPVWHGLSHIREEIEYTLSRNSDVIAYNSAPVLKVVGRLFGAEDKGESQRIIRVEENGDVAYVSWTQAIEALKYHVDTLLKLFFMQGQMPDLSFDNMKSLGNIGFDARQMVLSDAHLKIGDESGPVLEFLDRECNVIRAFLKQMNTAWANEIDALDIEHVITPFIQNDEDGVTDRLIKQNGGKAIKSQLETIQEIGSPNPQATLEQIQKEEASSSQGRISSLFSGEPTM